MLVQEYSDNARKSWIVTGDRFKDLAHLVAGFVEEAGESASILKRHCRGDFNLFESPEELERMKKELGDALWYLTILGEHVGFSLDDIMKSNNEKTLRRLAEGKLKGRGDDR